MGLTRRTEGEQRAYKAGVRAGIEFALVAVRTSKENLESLLLATVAFETPPDMVAFDSEQPSASDSTDYERIKPSAD